MEMRCHSIRRNECSSECFTFLGDKCMLFEFQFGEKTSATRLLFLIKRDKCRYDLLPWLHTWYFALAWTSVCFWSADNVSKLILSHTPHMSRHTFFQMNLIQFEWVEKEKKNCLASTNIHWLCSECGTYSIMLLHQPFSVWKFGLTFSTLRDFNDGFHVIIIVVRRCSIIDAWACTRVWLQFNRINVLHHPKQWLFHQHYSAKVSQKFKFGMKGWIIFIRISTFLYSQFYKPKPSLCLHSKFVAVHRHSIYS